MVAVFESKKSGVTQAIRTKLHFLDERLWKRFSARRLELIDTLDLSSKKASEQDEQIKQVAEKLRVEFCYGEEYLSDFDKLVRAAIQSVRRNRKRSSKSKKDEFTKRIRSDDMTDISSSATSGGSDYSNVDLKKEPLTGTMFISEISRLNSDSADDLNDRSYSKKVNFSKADLSRSVISSMIEPRLPSATLPHLPPLSKLAICNGMSKVRDPTSARSRLIHYIEKSKTCAESISNRNENIEELGRFSILSATAFVLEKSFDNANKSSVNYLRNSLQCEDWMAKFYVELDPYNKNSLLQDKSVALISLYTVIGSCIKDFGFDNIILPLSECIYSSIVKSYPLISQNSVAFRSEDHKSIKTCIPETKGSFDQLKSLASVASEMKEKTEITGRKYVSIQFLSSVLEFSYPTAKAATPKLLELIENAKVAFKFLPTDNRIISLRDLKSGSVIGTDLDVEDLFKSNEKVELEVFAQNPHRLPINEITSTVQLNKSNDKKIILPPPIPHSLPEKLSPLDGSSGSASKGFSFLSNLEDPPKHFNSYHTLPTPKLPSFPKFQPLL